MKTIWASIDAIQSHPPVVVWQHSEKNTEYSYTHFQEWRHLFVSFKRKGPTKDLADDLAQSSLVIKTASVAGSISAWGDAAHCTLGQDIGSLEQRKCSAYIVKFPNQEAHVPLGFLYKKINRPKQRLQKQIKDKEPTAPGVDEITPTPLWCSLYWNHEPENKDIVKIFLCTAARLN